MNESRSSRSASLRRKFKRARTWKAVLAAFPPSVQGGVEDECTVEEIKEEEERILVHLETKINTIVAELNELPDGSTVQTTQNPLCFQVSCSQLGRPSCASLRLTARHVRASCRPSTASSL